MAEGRGKRRGPQAFGDAAMAALEKPAADRSAALASVPADKDQKAVLDLLEAANPDLDKAGSLAALDRLIADTAQPQVYRDLAVLRRVAIAGTDQPLADRRTALQIGRRAGSSVPHAGRRATGLSADRRGQDG